jgi:hypothetical protein
MLSLRTRAWKKMVDSRVAPGGERVPIARDRHDVSPVSQLHGAQRVREIRVTQSCVL